MKLVITLPNTVILTSATWDGQEIPPPARLLPVPFQFGGKIASGFHCSQSLFHQQHPNGLCISGKRMKMKWNKTADIINMPVNHTVLSNSREVFAVSLISLHVEYNYYNQIHLSKNHNNIFCIYCTTCFLWA